jgi:hypothetical protein
MYEWPEIDANQPLRPSKPAFKSTPDARCWISQLSENTRGS